MFETVIQQTKKAQMKLDICVNIVILNCQVEGT